MFAEVDGPESRDWLAQWLKGNRDLWNVTTETPRRHLHRVGSEFESVKEMGVCPIDYKGRIFGTSRFFACRNLL